MWILATIAAAIAIPVVAIASGTPMWLAMSFWFIGFLHAGIIAFEAIYK